MSRPDRNGGTSPCRCLTGATRCNAWSTWRSRSLELVRRKVSDYADQRFDARRAALVEQLPDLVHGSEFAAQMRRFLPTDVHAATFERADALERIERTVRTQLDAGTAF